MGLAPFAGVFYFHQDRGNVEFSQFLALFSKALVDGSLDLEEHILRCSKGDLTSQVVVDLIGKVTIIDELIKHDHNGAFGVDVGDDPTLMEWEPF